MRTEHVKPPWRDFRSSNVITLPTGRTCPNLCPECKVARGHVYLNDSIELLQEGYNMMVEPRTQEAHEKKELLKEIIDGLRKYERGVRDALLLVSTPEDGRAGGDCEEISRCRC